MELNTNGMMSAMDINSLNNMIFQGTQMNNQSWTQMSNQGDNQLQNLYQNDFVNMHGSNKDINSTKSPWSSNEEIIF